MPITDPTTTIIAAITNEGRDALANTPGGTVAFKLQGFQVGKQGYNPASPNTTVPLVPTNTALISPLVDPGGSGYPTKITNFYSIEIPAVHTVSPVCRLGTSDTFADFVLGELGIFGKYLVNTAQPTRAPQVITGEAFGVGNGVQTTFVGNTANTNVKRNTLKVKHNAVQIGQDDGLGFITGTNINGLTSTINYDTGAITINYTVAPGGGVVITLDYETDGEDFLFAQAHFPAKGKTDKDVFVFRVVIAL